ncbi:MAG TPA: Gfo/Idh/MocA family oxidoreductase, partial [Gemmataceae bacterium]|nr:Gfo/Idh/MocA family oxidoreductase [Gemmataceae bacterium]
MPESHGVDRRDFLKAGAAGAAAVAFTAASYQRVYGANERIGVGFVGVGGRCQAHLDVINHRVKDKGDVRAVAVCDVWDGLKATYKGADGKERTYLQGLYPSAEKVGLDPHDKKHVVKEYERVLEMPEVDVVCIATPDHWHAKITIDALNAGKHVYCEKPMTKTIEEAQKVVDAAKKSGKVMSVGVQSMAEPRWRDAHQFITTGAIGHVAQAQTQYYRNSNVGQWRYYRLWKEMNPKTVDWVRWLGHNFKIDGIGEPLGPTEKQQPFDREVYAQWRCYWPYGGGMFTDLFVHQTTHMISAMGVRYPARVVGGGGLYLEYDDRDVPDVSAIVADYNEGCQLVVMATMINDYPIDEVIRGHLATVRFSRREGKMGYEVLPQNIGTGPGRPSAGVDAKGELQSVIPDKDTTPELWDNFLGCVRANNRETWSTPELGAAAFTTVAMGVKSYREGKALYWDAGMRQVREADASWAKRWEERSKKREKPKQVMGWNADDKGSTLHPEDYQALA